MRLHSGLGIFLILLTFAITVPDLASQSHPIYEVRKGDTIYKIARMYGITPAALKKINGLTTDTLRIGQTLQVARTETRNSRPASHAATAAQSSTAPAPNGSNRQIQENPLYTVRRGDTLNKIANAFEVFPDDLRRVNQLKNDRISIGQKLTIPLLHNAVPVAAASATTPRPGTTVTSPEPNTHSAAVAPAVIPVPVPTATISVPIPVTAASTTGMANASAENNAATPPSAPVLTIRTAHTNSSPITLTNAHPPSATPQETKRKQLVEASFQMLGIRYRFGGTSEKTGLDCSAFVKNLFAKFDMDLPRTSREQFTQGEKISRENLEPGDLVFFGSSSNSKRPNHVGIYIGNNQFIHSARKARKVVIDDLNKTWFRLRYLGARRIMELWWEDDEVPASSAPANATASMEK